MKKSFSKLTALFLAVLLILPLLASCDLFAEEDNSWMASVTFDEVTYTYDGTEKSVVLSNTENIPSSAKITYKNNKGTEVGTYKAEVTLTTKKGSTLTKRTIMVIDYPANESFATYCNNFLKDIYINEDQLAVNTFFKNPEDYGLEHYEASWYGYGGDVNEEIQLYETSLTELHTFDKSTLNKRDRYLYLTIEETLEYYIEYLENGYYLYEFNYISQFGGYPADLTSELRSYNLNSEQDVLDLIDILESVPECFASYVDFADDRIEAGIPLSEFTITEMNSYLDGVVEEGNDFYLGAYLCDKIDDCSFLTEEQKTTYKASVTSLMQNEFIEAHRDLSTALAQRIPAEESAEYPQLYEKQKEYYTLQIRHLLGISDLTMEDYTAYLVAEMEKAQDAMNTALENFQNARSIVQQDFINYVYADSLFVSGDYMTEYLPYLKEFATTIVPTLASNPDIEIETMDETAAEYSNAIAYYSLSYIDENATEYITLNPLSIDDKNELLSTMAHEGYPGHLYSYVFMKEKEELSDLQKMMTNTAFAEGWATYVQQSLYDYMAETLNGEAKKLALAYLKANHYLSYLVYTYADLGINYGIDGKMWSVSDVKTFFSNIGYTVDDDSALEIYRLLIECPTTYTSYGYGMHYFVDLHNEAKEALGDCYNEIDFNTELLSYGWVGYDIVEEYINNYIANEKYRNYITD